MKTLPDYAKIEEKEGFMLTNLKVAIARTLLKNTDHHVSKNPPKGPKPKTLKAGRFVS